MEISSLIQDLAASPLASRNLGSAAERQTLPADSTVKPETQQSVKAPDETGDANLDSPTGGGSASLGRGTLIDITV